MTNKQIAWIVLGIIGIVLIVCGYPQYLPGVGLLAFFSCDIDD